MFRCWFLLIYFWKMDLRFNKINKPCSTYRFDSIRFIIDVQWTIFFCASAKLISQPTHTDEFHHSEFVKLFLSSFLMMLDGHCYLLECNHSLTAMVVGRASRVKRVAHRQKLKSSTTIAGIVIIASSFILFFRVPFVSARAPLSLFDFYVNVIVRTTVSSDYIRRSHRARNAVAIIRVCFFFSLLRSRVAAIGDDRELCGIAVTLPVPSCVQLKL